jgi:hypothetical protein
VRSPEAPRRADERPSVALLMFSRNDLDQVWLRVQSLAGAIDEVVVVDSSDPPQYEAGRRSAPTVAPLQLLRAIPTGYADVLHPYGVAHVTSEWTFRLDADEVVSDPLRTRLRSPGPADGYFVPRWEAQLHAFSDQLRLFRTASYTAADPSFAHPGIHGTVASLRRDERIVHLADYRAFRIGGSKAARYANIESFERPLTTEYARAAVPMRRANPVRTGPHRGAENSRPPRPLSPTLAKAVLGLEALRSWAETGAPDLRGSIGSTVAPVLRSSNDCPPTSKSTASSSMPKFGVRAAWLDTWD